jgi:hypothetical protein
LPTEDPDLAIELHKLPPESMLLTCRDKLVVWSHKNPSLPDEPASQNMHAFGNAYLRNRDYEGWGEEIRSEGKMIWFYGKGLSPARLKGRIKWEDFNGEIIRFDRSNNRASVVNGLNGTLVDGNGNYDENRPATNPIVPKNPNSKDPPKNNNSGYPPIRNP